MPARTLLRSGITAAALLSSTALVPAAGVAVASPAPLVAQSGAAAPTLYGQRPIVIGHRGASAYRPEHTLAAYRLAIAQGADFIEPDLVSTKDHVLVARHENEISGTTDVAQHPEFAGRKATKVIDGTSITGWFTEDFTLAELRTLRATERLPEIRQENSTFDGLYSVPTFQQVIDLAARESVRLGRTIGLYPETKHPSYFRSIKLPLEEPLVRLLQRNGLDARASKVFVQSFEVGNLRLLRTKFGLKTRLVQLIDATGAPYDFAAAGDPRTYAYLVTPRGLAFVATYADGVGVNKSLIVPRGPYGYLLRPTQLVTNAHAAGLLVHTWTLRPENDFLPTNHDSSSDPADWGNWLAEFSLFFRLGVDGAFTDAPDLGVIARRSVLTQTAA